MSISAQHLERVGDKQFVIIVGAPRSGTSWLHRMLSEHPQVAGLRQEMTLFSKYLAPADKHYREETMHMERGDWKQGLPLLFDAAEFEAGLHKIVDAVYGRILDSKPTATHLIDKHPHYAGHLALIDRLLPTCKVVHIIRDGRDMAVSTMRTKRLKGHGQADIEGASKVWCERIRQARAYGAKLGPERFLELRYEQLLADTEAELARVLDFIHLDTAPELLQRIARENAMEVRTVSGGDSALNTIRRIPNAIWRSKLMLHERYLMERRAGDLLAELGYAQPNWWVLRWSDRPRLAWWLFRTRLRLLRNAIGQAMRFPAPPPKG